LPLAARNSAVGPLEGEFQKGVLMEPHEMTEAEAYEYELAYFKARLDDPSLLDRAIQVEGMLAVPIGGRRRGGYLSVADAQMSERAIARLAGITGFPNLRYEYEQDDDGAEYHLVRWGDAPPHEPNLNALIEFELEEGQFYGYSDRAISAYVNEQLNS